MVLVSHIYKFIYLKNYKVAGSSVESFFGQFCIDPSKKEQYSFEDKQDEQVTQWGILGSRLLRGPKPIWFNHKSAKEVKEDIGDTIFNNYYKFCVVRNPYDLMVSSYFWEQCKNLDFKSYCKQYVNTNIKSNLTRMFIDKSPVCNYYIRYENLINDILVVLDILKITDYNINDLPHHKSNITPKNISYRDYYDDETKEIVSKLFEKEIEMFDYKF